jgi:hypothetical protein
MEVYQLIYGSEKEYDDGDENEGQVVSIYMFFHVWRRYWVSGRESKCDALSNFTHLSAFALRV